MKLTRRGFLASTGAALSVRALPQIAAGQTGRRIVTVAYDKALGMMRLVERVVP